MWNNFLLTFAFIQLLLSKVRKPVWDCLTSCCSQAISRSYLSLQFFLDDRLDHRRECLREGDKSRVCLRAKDSFWEDIFIGEGPNKTTERTIVIDWRLTTLWGISKSRSDGLRSVVRLSSFRKKYKVLENCSFVKQEFFDRIPKQGLLC